jgi:hypothetical protein
MGRTAIVQRDDPARDELEAFIKRIYRLRYDARIEEFPEQLIAFRGDKGETLCAAGLRTAQDGFFSESYLDAPIEEILGRLSRSTVNRSAIVEVTTLVSLAPAEMVTFITEMIAFGLGSGFSWCFFTATVRLRRMVEKLGLGPIYLANADHRRIDNSERWGRYYAEQPQVFAITRPVQLRAISSQEAAHAVLA